jgi:hypothetical protein
LRLKLPLRLRLQRQRAENMLFLRPDGLNLGLA